MRVLVVGGGYFRDHLAGTQYWYGELLLLYRARSGGAIVEPAHIPESANST